MHDRQQGRGDRRLAAGKRQSRRAAIERRQPLFQNVGGGVHQAGVDIAELPQAEEIGRMLGVMEHIARGCIDRHGASGRGGIGHLARVQRQGAEVRKGVFFVTHSELLLGKQC